MFTTPDTIALQWMASDVENVQASAQPSQPCFKHAAQQALTITVTMQK
jgi:hypothetical protein